MRTVFRAALWMLALGAVALVVAAVVGAAFVWPQLDGTLSIDGETVEFGALHGDHALLAIGGVLLALVTVLVVVPAALLFGLGLPALLAGLVLLLGLAVAGVALAIVFSPLLLLGLLGWWLWKRSRGAARIPG